MYRGLEDEIIKTIETGDVGLTLPGSQLLGYSSNKSGLFGLKVTGQVGRADFTVVASKQKAESSSKSFNAKGGQVSDNIILSSDYLNNRFFRLDLPASEPFGRSGDARIRYSDLKVFQMMPTGQFQPGEITNVAVYVDVQGYSVWPDSVDFSAPADYGPRWREVTNFDTLLDSNGGLIALDMRTRLDDSDVLAVVYTVETATGQVLGTVGDNPDLGLPTQALPNVSGTFYRMKQLKAVSTNTHPHVFGYVLRNIYSLGGANIDPSTFELRIERADNTLQPAQDENGIDYVRIFGLDSKNAQGVGGPDGLADADDTYLFDLNRGLLKFPLDFPQPFNGAQEKYEAYADTSVFSWDGTFLATNLAPGLYDPNVQTSEYPGFARFRIVARHAAASSNFNLGASNIEEGSETVTLDGRMLTRDVDYEIDYTFGEIQLKGEAANLTADSKIARRLPVRPVPGRRQHQPDGLQPGLRPRAGQQAVHDLALPERVHRRRKGQAGRGTEQEPGRQPEFPAYDQTFVPDPGGQFPQPERLRTREHRPVLGRAGAQPAQPEHEGAGLTWRTSKASTPRMSSR